MKKKLLLAVMLCCSILLPPKKVSAQAMFFGYGYTVGSMNNSDFKKFAASYEREFSGIISKSKMKLGFASGWTWHADFIAGAGDGFGMIVGFRRTKWSSEAHAVLNEGTRRFQMNCRSWDIPIGMAFYEGGLMSSFSLAVGMSNNYLLCTYEYNSGVSSAGIERNLNGVYSGWNMYLAPRMTINMLASGFGIPLPLSFGVDIGYQLPVYSSPLEEKMYLDGNLDVNSADAMYTYLPRDYGAFNRAPADYDFSDNKNLVRSGMRGIQVMMSVKLFLAP